MRLTTEQARAKLLDYCAAMLPASEAAQVELALLDDAVLAEEAQRLRDLLGAAKRADALEWTPERSAANFAAVAAALSAAGHADAEAWPRPRQRFRLPKRCQQRLRNGLREGWRHGVGSPLQRRC